MVLRVIGDEACPLPPFLQVVIDVVKHGVLGKFNDVRPGIYREFMKDLCEKVGGWLGVAVYIGWVWVVGSTRLGGVWVVGKIRLGGVWVVGRIRLGGGMGGGEDQAGGGPCRSA